MKVPSPKLDDVAGLTRDGGYRCRAYAASLAEFGEPLELPRCGGWLLKRRIPGTDLFDAMGCYPLFCCKDWTRLEEDLEALRGSLVSVALVTDPFGNWDSEHLKNTFTVARHFKDHFVCDLSGNLEDFVSRHHRRYARKSLQTAQVEVVPNPSAYLDEWLELYSVLVERHKLSGIKAFSSASFARQLAMPGLMMLRIKNSSSVLGSLLWVIQNGVAYAHLMALNEAGYEANAFYGLFFRSIELFKGDLSAGVTTLHYGGGSGSSGNDHDGMMFFKKGWSTGVKPVWFLGKILDAENYTRLSETKGTTETSYFPYYRNGEF